MDHRHHRAPRECPVCRDQLRVTRLGCDNCGTGISGDFEQCEFCALDSGDRDVLRVFLASRGNIKELERHLGVSYPTARARFDDLIRKLGLTAGPPVEPASAPSVSPSSPAPSASPSPDPRLRTLEALAAGELDVEQARRLIDGR
jgi:hypothetical protein